jgi:hypothetical protein
LSWDKAIATADNEVRNAEKDLLSYVAVDAYPPWVRLYSDGQIRDALEGIRAAFGSLVYIHPDPNALIDLVRNLTRATPPILASTSRFGTVRLERCHFTQMLYAGWVFWLGRARFPTAQSLPFFDINRLCNQALMQQQAIDKFLT